VLALGGALALGFGLYVATHGGKLSSLSHVSRGLKGQVSNQQLLGVATDLQPTDAQGFADITLLNNYFAQLQKQIESEREARQEQYSQIQTSQGGY
jgi:hypothetical protein